MNWLLQLTIIHAYVWSFLLDIVITHRSTRRAGMGALAQTPRIDRSTRLHASTSSRHCRSSASGALLPFSHSLRDSNSNFTWNIHLDKNHKELTDFTLKYSVGFLMNLCLRSKDNLHCITSVCTVFSSSLIFLLENCLTLVLHLYSSLVCTLPHTRMNNAGKRACIADASCVLRVLSALLGH